MTEATLTLEQAISLLRLVVVTYNGHENEWDMVERAEALAGEIAPLVGLEISR